MYIGPWQEYRLAKIHDDMIQRLRHEWEAQLRGQVPSGDDDRIRDFMQPLVAKLPSLLLAAKSSNSGTRNRRVVGSQSGLTSGTTSRCSSRPVSAVSNSSSASTRTSSSGAREAEVLHRHTKVRENNQEAHNPNHSRAPRKPPRPIKKGKKAPLTALDQVQKRKKMFATWIKQAANGEKDAPEQGTQTATPEAKEDINTSIRLPPIHSVAPVCAVTLHRVPETSSSSVLPVLSRLGASTDASLDVELSHQTSFVSPLISGSIPAADIDLDESVDDEEVNNLLNWTETLLSPQALDSLCNFDN